VCASPTGRGQEKGLVTTGEQSGWRGGIAALGESTRTTGSPGLSSLFRPLLVVRKGEIQTALFLCVVASFFISTKEIFTSYLLAFMHMSPRQLMFFPCPLLL
jgi:hypothetical protein